MKKYLKSGNYERINFEDGQSQIIESNGVAIYEMFANGGGREIEIPSTPAPDPISALANSIAENAETKGRTVRMAATVAGVTGVCVGTAGAGCAPAIRLGTGVIQSEMSAADIEKDRRAGVRDAWRLEADAVRNGGTGSRDWTAAERQELIDTGKVSGYEGHHINSVNEHPQLARDPNNIKFVDGRNGRKEHLKEHRGNFRNPTRGPLIRRR